jgi:hypothetical protein
MCHHARQARIMKSETEGPLLTKVKLACHVLETGCLSTLARLVFADLLLSFHNTRNGQCNPKVTVIAGRLGRAEYRVRLAIRELVDFGVLIAKRRRGASDYSFPALIQDRSKTSDLGGADGSFSLGLDRAKTPAQHRAKSPALNKENLNRQIEPKERASEGCGPSIARINTSGDRGRYEIEIANRLSADGSDGLSILGGLPFDEVDQLCAQQRRGTLSDNTIEELRGRRTGSAAVGRRAGVG